jgi:hypothetical protein
MALKEGTTILSKVHSRFIHKNYIGMAKKSQKPQNELSKILGHIIFQIFEAS